MLGYRSLLLCAVLGAFLGTSTQAAEPPPVLRVQAGGPTSFVTSLALSPEGDRLYAAGYDKVVHTWRRGADGQFVPDPTRTFRVPIGPGSEGVLNALAISPDGKWLAVAGKGTARDLAGFHEHGLMVHAQSRLSRAMRLDRGTIHVFNTATGQAVTLRDHLGVVLGLTFVPSARVDQPLLLSAARDHQGSQYVGGLRLWDVAGNKVLAATQELPDAGDDQAVIRPGLAAWRIGNEPKAIHVAVAWKDGRLRVWDVAGERLTVAGQDGESNDTLAYLPDGREGGRLISGSQFDGLPVLRTWTVRGGAVTASGLTELGDNPATPRVLAIRPVAGKPGGQVVVALHRAENAEEHAYRLMLVDLTGGENKVAASTPLWKLPVQAQPALAVAANGERLAAAGQFTHEIWVYELGQGSKLGERQRLASAGMQYVEASFVEKDGKRGLALRESNGTEWVADLGRRDLVPRGFDWLPDQPGGGRWTVERLENPRSKRITLNVSRGGSRVGRVTLPAGRYPTASRVWPAADGDSRSLLAVGFVEQGVAVLGIFDAETGQELRHCVGHVNPIRHLAFSRDGRRLVSVGGDQTVCVWGLDDLDELRHGMLRGLEIDTVGGVLRLRSLTIEDASSANRAALNRAEVKAGDSIEGLTLAGRAVKTPTAREFTEALLSRQAGTKVGLKIRNRGEVSLTLDRAIDERKPLFTLFVSTPDAAGKRQWIGWRPLGPYDAGDPAAAEKYIGWHRNTSDPERPVSFSAADQYRREFYSPGLLRILLQSGDPRRAEEQWEDWLRANTRVAATFDVHTRQDGNDPPTEWQGRMLVRHPPALVTGLVHGIVPRKLDTLRWQLGDGPARAFSVRKDNGIDQASFESSLENLDWKRGEHDFELVGLPGAERRKVPLLYLPPAPTVELLEMPRRQEKVPFVLRARVTPGKGVAPRDVRIIVRHNQQVLELKVGSERIEEEGRLRVEKTVDLRESENQFEIQAENVGLLEKYRELESAAGRFSVFRERMKGAPPTITLTDIIPEGSPSVAPPRKGADPLDLPVRRFRVVGQVVADFELKSATINDRPLAGFKPGLTELKIDEAIALSHDQAGQVVRFAFQATSLDGLARTPPTLAVRYQPRPPSLVLEKPQRLSPSKEPVEVVLGRLVPAANDDFPYEVQVRVGEKAIATDSIAHDPTDDMLRVKLPVPPGDSTIEILVKNRLTTRPSQTLKLYGLRLPRVESVARPKVGDDPRFDLEAMIESPRDLPIRGIRLDGSQRLNPELAAGEWKASGEPIERDGKMLWKVTIPAVPLRKGENNLSLLVRNADGAAVGSHALRPITYTEPLPAPPSILQIPQDGNTSQAGYRDSFTVRTPTRGPLQEVTVVRTSADGKAETRTLADLKLDKSTVPGVNRYSLDFTLDPGPNTFTVVAINRGGKSLARTWTRSYIRRTRILHLDELVVADSPDRPLRPTVDREGSLQFPQAGTGAVTLKGRVEWTDLSDPTIAEPSRVRVWVNDFEQLDADLRPPEGQFRPFEIGLRLNNGSNRVHLEFPGLQFEENRSGTSFTVPCRRPVREQLLHLLVVAPGDPRPRTVRDQVLKVFKARQSDEDNFEAPPSFVRGRVYGPVLTSQGPQRLYKQLERIKQIIRYNLDPFNHVVIVYFQGEELVTPTDTLLLTELSLANRDEPERRDAVAIHCKRMQASLADAKGAKLLLLSTRRLGEQRPADLQDNRIALLHCVWEEKESVEDAHLRGLLLTMLEKALGRSRTLQEVEADLRKQQQAREELPKKYAEMLQIAYNKVLASLSVGARPALED